MSSKRGNFKENRVLDLKAAEGWFGICGRASRGPADVLIVKAGERPQLIQVKGDKTSPYANFRQEDRQLLLEAARQAGGDAWLAWWPPRTKAPVWIPPDSWPKARVPLAA